MEFAHARDAEQTGIGQLLEHPAQLTRVQLLHLRRPLMNPLGAPFVYFSYSCAALVDHIDITALNFGKAPNLGQRPLDPHVNLLDLQRDEVGRYTGKKFLHLQSPPKLPLHALVLRDIPTDTDQADDLACGVVQRHFGRQVPCRQTGRAVNDAPFII